MNRSTLEKRLACLNHGKSQKIYFLLKNKDWISFDFKKGSSFPCPERGAEGKSYDIEKKTWRHLNFFQHETYIHARVPRVECTEGCGIKTMEVPWARPRSGFSLLFEALIMTLAREMPVAAIAALIGEHDTRIWRVLHHYVEEARKEMDCFEVERIGMDETASRRGHNYITLFYDLDEKRLLFGTSGRDQGVVSAFAEDLRVPVEEMIVHHDQDSVYTSHRWTSKLLLEDKIRLSYALNGAKDNPEMESFNSYFKTENRSLFLDAETLAEL